RSSYNGLLLFLFIVAAAWLAATVIRRFASGALRRAPAWDCGFPDASPLTQYTSASFAQPIRRVFGSVVFHAREEVQIPAPGQTLPARFHVSMRDLVWDAVYAPVESVVNWTSDRLNKVQFWTIRAYLTLVFGAVVLLLMVLAVWH
ncbi:MAG TPA: hypothetical protein VD791_00655, partial [Burkholderiales bacterium]|nr:hypothetical protein [Burkholderiales bacterium]